MGRKIPGKKHHGVKDPEKQKAKRDEALKLKVNSAPKSIDDQEVPKKLQMIAKLREETKQRAKQKNVKKVKSDSDKDLLDSSKHMGYEMRLPGMKKSLRPVPVFKQEPGEKERQFFRRVNNTVTQFLKQKEYEAKYNVDLVQDERGKTNFVKREKDELDDHVEQLKIKQLGKKGIVKKTKEQKRKERRLKEKERKLKKKRRKGGANAGDQEELNFDDFSDRVEFNEVVHAPPRLPTVKNNEARRPGRKDLLLAKPDSGRVKKSKNIRPGDQTKLKKKVKMSMAQKVRLESEQKSVIEQYRALKKGKNNVTLQ